MPRYGITLLLLKVIQHRIAIIQSLQICRQSVLIWITSLFNVYGIPIVTTRPTLYVMPKLCELNFRELKCSWYINQEGTSIVLPQATRTSTSKKLKQPKMKFRIKMQQACWRHIESTLIPLDEENLPISGIKIFWHFVKSKQKALQYSRWMETWSATWGTRLTSSRSWSNQSSHEQAHSLMIYNQKPQYIRNWRIFGSPKPGVRKVLEKLQVHKFIGTW